MTTDTTAILITSPGETYAVHDLHDAATALLSAVLDVRQKLFDAWMSSGRSDSVEDLVNEIRTSFRILDAAVDAAIT